MHKFYLIILQPILIELTEKQTGIILEIFKFFNFSKFL
jgi:hypothetical protein